MKLARTVIAATVTLSGGLAMAVPAQADHFTEANVTLDGKGRVCSSGELASGTGQYLVDNKANIKVRKDGSERWTCTFRNVGPSSYEENGILDYEVPTTTLRYTAVDNCWLHDGDDLVGVADAEIVSKPNGTIIIKCDIQRFDDHDHVH